MPETLFDKNLQCIRNRFPQLYSELENHTPNGNAQDIPAQSGHPSLIINSDGEPSILHSPENPVAEASSLIQGMAFYGEDLTILMGPGLGYLPLAILSRMHPEHLLFIIEADLEIMFKSFQLQDLTRLFSNERVHLFHTDQIQQLWDALDKEQLRILGGHVKKLIYPPAFKLNQDVYGTVEEKIENWVVAAQDNYHTLNKSGELAEKSILGNLLSLPDSAPLDPLGHLVKDIPALVVAAGPSLDKNIQQIKSYQDRLMIISVDSALRPLLKADIRPDILVAVDPAQVSARKYEKIAPELLQKIPIVYSPCVLPAIPPLFHGPKFIFNVHHLLCKWALSLWHPVIHLPNASTVSHYAFYLARLMGASPILFAGLDLAFTGNRDHASDCAQLWKIEDNPDDNYFEYVQDVFGEIVPTHKVFIHMQTVFEKEIAQTETLCIDATEGGAYIKGTTVMPLAEAVDRFANIRKPDVFSMVMELWKKHRINQVDGIKKGLLWLSDESEQVKGLCEKALSLTPPLLDAIENRYDGMAGFQDSIDRINSISDDMETHSSFREILKDRLPEVLIKQFQLKYQIERAENEQDRLRIRIRQSHLFFEKMKQVADSVCQNTKPLLEKLSA